MREKLLKSTSTSYLNKHPKEQGITSVLKEQNTAQASRNRSPALERAALSLGIDAGPIP